MKGLGSGVLQIASRHDGDTYRAVYAVRFKGALYVLHAFQVTRIDEIFRRRRLTQTQAAELLGLSQPDVSRLLRGNFREYSIERQLRLLMALGRDVDIVIRKPRSRRPGKLSIDAA